MEEVNVTVSHVCALCPHTAHFEVHMGDGSSGYVCSCCVGELVGHDLIKLTSDPDWKGILAITRIGLLEALEAEGRREERQFQQFLLGFFGTEEGHD